MQLGPTKLIAIRSGSYDYAEVELSDSLQLVGPNNAGKTTLINTLQFLYLDNRNQMVFGDHAQKLAISSTKSMTGHLLGAGGAVEAIACIKAIAEGWAPPTINLTDPDPKCDLDYVPNEGRAMPIKYAMSNSFAFGGLNAVLLFGAPPA